MMNRRTFVLGTSAVCALLGSGCRRIATREDVLRQLVQEVVIPEIRALPRANQALLHSLRQLGSEQGLEQARTALRASLLAWQRAQAFRSGPLVESNALLRSTFWPSRKLAIDAAIEAGDSIDAALVERLGVDAKGLYALELMLFDDGLRASWFAPARVKRASALAVAFAQDVSQRTDAAITLLGDGKAFADQVAAAGQESLNRLVNQMVETCETIAADRLLRVLGLQEHDRLLPEQIHGGFSGLSTQLPRVWLESTQRLYLGHDGSGLCALVKQAAPAIDGRVRSAFASALAGMESLKEPLERVVQRDRAQLQQAASKVRALEVALKSELAASLGVTLSIVSGDGD
jgi:predicted lipoprotein